MTQIDARIHTFIDRDDAVGLVAKYYGGSYTGSRFDLAPQLVGPDPHRFTAHDVAAVATLSVPLSGPAVIGLLEHDDELAAGLRPVPTEVDLADASDADLDSIYAVQRVLDRIEDIGHVTRSKLLAHKRPRLVPIRDRYVLQALIDRDSGPLTQPLRDALAADPSITQRLLAVREKADIDPGVSTIRVLDVIVWMATHGDPQAGEPAHNH